MNHRQHRRAQAAQMTSSRDWRFDLVVFIVLGALVTIFFAATELGRAAAAMLYSPGPKPGG
jgi:hypothetical protein